jgi:hypothetical protein
MLLRRDSGFPMPYKRYQSLDASYLRLLLQSYPKRSQTAPVCKLLSTMWDCNYSEREDDKNEDILCYHRKRRHKHHVLNKLTLVTAPRCIFPRSILIISCNVRMKFNLYLSRKSFLVYNVLSISCLPVSDASHISI